MQMRSYIVQILFVCLLACLSDLKNCCIIMVKSTNLKKMKILSPFDVPLTCFIFLLLLTFTG